MSVDKKIISPHNAWYIGNFLVCAQFSSKLAHGTYCLCFIKKLFRLLGIVWFFPMFMSKPCSSDFNDFDMCGFAHTRTVLFRGHHHHFENNTLKEEAISG